MSAIAVLKAPGLRISICANATRKGARVYCAWQVRESVRGGPVMRRTFALLQDAEQYAEDRAKFLTGQSRPLSMSDRQSFDAALLNLAHTGRTLAGETALGAQEDGILAAGGVPRGSWDMARLEGAREMARRWPGRACHKTLQECVEEFLEQRRKERVSKPHFNDLKNRLRPFAKAMKCAMSELAAAPIQAWMDSREVVNRTLLNDLRALRNFVRWAKLKEYLPAQFAELDRLNKIKVDAQPVKIFTPAEMRCLLGHAAESVLPVFLLCGFAGLRTSETLLLNWSHVDWEKDSLIVPPEGKTKERRVPMEPNLRSWLEPLRNVGRVVPITMAGVAKAFEWTVEKANRNLRVHRSAITLEWRRNGLRHSYATYQARLQENHYRVAIWTGHSMKTLKKYYCNDTVTDEAARGWFAIFPEPKAVQLSLFSEAQRETSCPEFARNGSR